MDRMTTMLLDREAEIRSVSKLAVERYQIMESMGQAIHERDEQIRESALQMDILLREAEEVARALQERDAALCTQTKVIELQREKLRAMIKSFTRV